MDQRAHDITIVQFNLIAEAAAPRGLGAAPALLAGGARRQPPYGETRHYVRRGVKDAATLAGGRAEGFLAGVEKPVENSPGDFTF